MFVCIHVNLAWIAQILKWQHALREVEAKLAEQQQQETVTNNKIKEGKIELSKLKKACIEKEYDLKNCTKKLEEYKSEIRNMQKSFLENQKVCIGIQLQIDKKKAEYNNVFKECKVCTIF